MERKTKHRILGVLVIIGLVIIILPFLQVGNEPKTDPGVVKAPPFPDQSVQVNEPANKPEVNSVQNTSDSTTSQPSGPSSVVNEPVATTDTTPVSSVNQPTDNAFKTSVTEAITQPTADAVKSADAKIIPFEKKPEPVKSDASGVQNNIPDTGSITPKTADNPVSTDDTEMTRDNGQDTLDKPEELTKVVKTAMNEHLTPDPKEKPKANKAVKLTAFNRKNHKAYAKLPIDNDGLFKLKNAVWVIQIGSFNNKANALRLVNQLRTNGYRAFIQQMSSASGETRVFVGPEVKQNAARELASQLETDMHLHGIVISYKPLTL